MPSATNTKAAARSSRRNRASVSPVLLTDEDSDKSASETLASKTDVDRVLQISDDLVKHLKTSSDLVRRESKRTNHPLTERELEVMTQRTLAAVSAAKNALQKCTEKADTGRSTRSRQNNAARNSEDGSVSSTKKSVNGTGAAESAEKAPSTTSSAATSPARANRTSNTDEPAQNGHQMEIETDRVEDSSANEIEPSPPRTKSKRLYESTSSTTSDSQAQPSASSSSAVAASSSGQNARAQNVAAEADETEELLAVFTNGNAEDKDEEPVDSDDDDFVQNATASTKQTRPARANTDKEPSPTKKKKKVAEEEEEDSDDAEIAALGRGLARDTQKAFNQSFNDSQNDNGIEDISGEEDEDEQTEVTTAANKKNKTEKKKKVVEKEGETEPSLVGLPLDELEAAQVDKEWNEMFNEDEDMNEDAVPSTDDLEEAKEDADEVTGPAEDDEILADSQQNGASVLDSSIDSFVSASQLPLPVVAMESRIDSVWDEDDSDVVASGSGGRAAKRKVTQSAAEKALQKLNRREKALDSDSDEDGQVKGKAKQSKTKKAKRAVSDGEEEAVESDEVMVLSSEDDMMDDLELDDDDKDDSFRPKGSAKSGARAKGKKGTVIKSDDSDSDFEEDVDDGIRGKTGDTKRSTRARAPVTEKKGSRTTRRVVLDSDESAASDPPSDKEDSDQEEVEEEEEEAPSTSRSRKQAANSKKGKGLRTKYKALGQDTRNAVNAEKERMNRLKEKQKMYNAIEFDSDAEEEEPEADSLELSLLNESLASQTSLNNAPPKKKQKRLKKVVLDQNEEGEELCSVDDRFVRVLKPHQAEGIKFMFDCMIESVSKIGDAGGGGILAHEMGLGKTLQTIVFLHSVLTHPVLKQSVKYVLIVVPKNVIQNWIAEFRKWFEIIGDTKAINVMALSVDEIRKTTAVKKPKEIMRLLEMWNKRKGVLVTNYELYRNVVQGDIQSANAIRTAKRTGKPRKLTKPQKAMLAATPEFRQMLCEGPDMVVCDEGHLLKNEDALISQCMNLIRTKRRLCLTGTPLQNRLEEYYTMVQFVKPGLLGTKAEFANHFKVPIERGQFSTSSKGERKRMVARTNILCRKLDGVVNRHDWMSVNAKYSEYLMAKHEYVLSIKLSAPQIKLYEHYLTDVCGLRDYNNTRALTKEQNKEALKDRGRVGPIHDFHQLNRLWTHPCTLIIHKQDKELKEQRRIERDGEDLDDFVDDASESSAVSTESEKEDDDGDTSDEDNVRPSTSKKQTRQERNEKRETAKENMPEEDEGRDTPTTIPTDWWEGLRDADNDGDAEGDKDGQVQHADDGLLVRESMLDDPTLSGKLMILLDMLRMCEQVGDKLLVFSQRVETLDFIERFLKNLDGTWFEEERERLHAENESKWRWQRNYDYFRIDGQTDSTNRTRQIDDFQDPDNLRARLFLISTRAGGIGINLMAANRVVLFDVSWNPSHDMQALFRVFRFGQKKPVYIYRFVAQGTMEEVIYDRQAIKLSTAVRCVDDQQIENVIKDTDVTELYKFTPVAKHPNAMDSRIAGDVPKDRMLAEILRKDCGQWVAGHHVQDLLFKRTTEDVMTQAEQDQAWAEYESERKRGGRAFRHDLPSMANSNLNAVVQLRVHQVQQLMAQAAHSGILQQAQHDQFPKAQLGQLTQLVNNRWSESDPDMCKPLIEVLFAFCLYRYHFYGSQMAMEFADTLVNGFNGLATSATELYNLLFEQFVESNKEAQQKEQAMKARQAQQRRQQQQNLHNNLQQLIQQHPQIGAGLMAAGEQLNARANAGNASGTGTAGRGTVQINQGRSINLADLNYTDNN